MKKLYNSLWAKILAAFLWSGAVIGTAISIGNMIYTYDEDYERVLQKCQKNIMDNLAAKAISIIPGDSEEEQWHIEEDSLEEQEYQRNKFIGEMGKSVEFALVAGKPGSHDEPDLSDSSAYVYKSPGFDEGSYSYVFKGNNHVSYYWGEKSLITLAGQERYFYTYDIYNTERIKGYVLEEKTGILYIETVNAAYPVEQFTVWEEDGKKVSQAYQLSEDGGYVSQDGKTLEWEGKNIGISLRSENYNEEEIREFEPYQVAHTEGAAGEIRLFWTGRAQEEDRGYETISGEEKIESEKKILYGYITNKGRLCVMADDYTRYWVLMTPKTSEQGSLMADLESVLGKVYALKNFYPVLIVLGIIVFVVMSIYLICAAGHRKGQEQVVLSKRDGVWLEVLTVAVVALETLGALGIMAVEEIVAWLPFHTFVFLILFLALWLLLLFVAYVLNVVTRLKAHQFMRYTMVYSIWHFVRLIWRHFAGRSSEIYRKLRENTGLIAKSLLIMLGIWIIESIFIMFMYVIAYKYFVEPVLLGIVAFLFLEKGIMMEVVLQLHRLQKGSERIAAGQLDAKIDTKGLFWEFRKHGDNLNKISDGIQAAVQEQMKSEHFKTELITNVSHDIKTPLTSIINYVDLMKKEEIEDPTMKSYVEVLDRQSARLKKLIEDLMEASKASTGSLEVNFEQCDVGVLMTQMVGEYEERAAAESLQFIVSGSDAAIMIMADGRHLWRVFDNLLGNACKYAMPGTRVYIDLHAEDVGTRVAVITFKNVSRSQLNISSEELMERFVRGDSSRNTEGSGLGLSIAQSLTELMGGTMVLVVDGDLFKVILRFPILQ